MLMVAATPVLGQNAFVEGMLGMNEVGDVILNSSAKRHVLVNGVDILADLTAMRTQLAALNSTVRAQAAIITAMNDTIATLNSRLNSTISTQAATVTSLNNTITTLTSTSATLDSTVNAQAARITSLNGTISTLSDTSATVNSEFNTHITTLNSAVDAQAATITSQYTAQNGKIASLNSTVNAHSTTLERLTGSSASRAPTVLGDLVGCTNASAQVAEGANLVSGLLHDGFCDDTWVQTIGGTWNESRTYLTSLELDALARVNGSIDLSFNRLTLVNFGTLTFVGGDIDVRNNTGNGLSQVSLGHLGHVGGTVYLLDTVFTIRNNVLASTGPISWTGKQLIDFGAGGVTTVNSPSVLLGADAVDMGGVTTVTGSLTILSAMHLDFGALVNVLGTFTVFDRQVPLLPNGVINGSLSWDYAGIERMGPESPPGILRTLHLGSICTRMDGSLYLYSNQLTSLTFGSLKSISGYLTVSENELTSISFGSLTFVGGSVFFYRNKLTSVTFGALAYIGGSFELGYNLLSSITFSSLTSVSYLAVSRNPLTSITFGSLGVINGPLYLSYTLLTSITFPPSLSVTGTISVCSNPGTPSLFVTCQARYSSKCSVC